MRFFDKADSFTLRGNQNRMGKNKFYVLKPTFTKRSLGFIWLEAETAVLMKKFQAAIFLLLHHCLLSARNRNGTLYCEFIFYPSNKAYKMSLTQCIRLLQSSRQRLVCRRYSCVQVPIHQGLCSQNTWPGQGSRSLHLIIGVMQKRM